MITYHLLVLHFFHDASLCLTRNAPALLV
jgi:hypothetical protein